MAYGDSIKIHITAKNDDSFGGESVWAEELGNNQARVNNLPFFTDACGFNDIVEYYYDDGIKEFKKVIKKVTNSWGVTWDPTDKDDRTKTSEEWQTIAKHLRSNDVKFESAMAGLFVIALPAEKEDEENITWLKALNYSCPIELKLYIGDDDEESELE